MAFQVQNYSRYNTRIFTEASAIGDTPVTGAISELITANLTASRALISNISGKIEVSPVTSTELLQLQGIRTDVTIQDQIDGLQTSITTGDLTEATSSVLTITGGTDAVIGDVSIQVKQANGSQGGYLSSADWTTFNSKQTSSLANGYILIGNGTAQAVNVNSLGDIGASVAGGLTIQNSVITNAHINSAAAITRTKLAAGTAYRLVVNNASGVISENAAITGNRALVSNANGQPTHSSVTDTVLGYIANLTSDAQTQISTTLAGFQLSSLVTAPSASENGFALTWDEGAQEFTLTDPVTQGIPVGGSTNTVLAKLSGTDYDADWTSLTLAFIGDVTASAADVNVMEGADGNSVTPTIISYLGGATPVTSSIQSQLNDKLSNSLSPGAIYYGNPSGDASQLAATTDGYVLTLVGGYPQWQLVSGTGTVTSIDISGGTSGLTFTGGPITASGTITLNSGTLDETYGGTGNASYTKGDILVATGASTLVKLSVGTNGQALVADSGEASGTKWATVSSVVADADYGDITVSSTGTVWTIDAGINKAWTGTHSWLDNSWSLKDNIDNTKILAFQLSGITAGNTRTMTIPDLSGTLAVIGGSGNGAALTKVDDTNVTLTFGGGPTTALLTATSITAGWSGQLAVTRGGTGLASVSQGDILYADASNSLTMLAKNTSATRYLSNTGSSNNPAWAQIDLTNGVTGTLPIANGGTGSTAGAWLLSGTSTLAGTATITSNTANQHVFNGTWTTTASDQYHIQFAGSITTRATASSDNITGYSFVPSMTPGAAGSVNDMIGVDINPTFSVGGINPTRRTSLRVVQTNIANSQGLEVKGYGGGVTTPIIRAWDGATTYFSVRNDAKLQIGGATNPPFLYPGNSASLAVNTSGTTVRLTTRAPGGGTTSAVLATDYDASVGNSNVPALIALGNNTSYVVSNGSGAHKVIDINGITYNFTGTNTSNVYGLYYNPTVTSVLGTHYAAVFASGLSGFGTLTPTATLQAKGRGTTTGELFRLDDSASTNRLLVLDNGTTTFVTAASTNTVSFNIGGATTTISGSSNDARLNLDGDFIGGHTATVANSGIVQAGRTLTLRTLNNGQVGNVTITSSATYTSGGKTLLSVTAPWSGVSATTNNLASFTGSITNTSGSAINYRTVLIAPTYAHSGTVTTSNVYGIYYSPTLTGLTGTTHYAAVFESGLSGFGTLTPVSTLESATSFGAAITSVSADTTLSVSHYTVKVDASGANRTITLPAASGCTRRIYVIIKSDSSGNTVTIDGNGSETISGSTTKVISTQYAGYMIQSDGSNWFIISTF